MSTYSIKYLENITGIKSHTIRIWEKRYGLLVPKRTPTNIRYYDDEDLRKILNVITLLKEGYKISHIAEMKHGELAVKAKAALNTPLNPNQLYDYFTNEIILAALAYEKALLDKYISTCVLKFSFSNTVEHILYPALKRTGILWQSQEASPGQEHFFSNIVRQKLFSAIDGLAEPADDDRKCLLFLPENEDHEIGLLYFYYLLLRAGIRSFYLGQRTPFDSLTHAAAAIKPTHLVLFVTTVIPAAQRSKYLRELATSFAAAHIILCGDTEYIQKLKLPENCTFLSEPLAAYEYFKLG